MAQLTWFLGRAWFYLALIAVFLLGWLVPGVGSWLKGAGVMPYLVVVAFFLNGFVLSTASVLASLRQWQVLGVASVITFALAPALVFGMRQVMPGGNTEIGQGFQLLAVVPTMLVSTVVLTRIARGDAAVALYITIATNLMAIVIVPLLLKATLGGATTVNVADTAGSLVLTVLLPTLAGQLVRWRWQHRVARYERPAGILSQCVILLFILTGMPHAAVPHTVLLLVFLGVLALHAVLFVTAWFGGRLLPLDVATRRALTFCGAQKSMAFLVILFDRIYGPFAPNVVLLPGITYYITELAVDSVIAQVWGHRLAEDASLPPGAN